MIRFAGFFIGATFAAFIISAPAQADWWPFGGPAPLDEIVRDVAKTHDDITHITPEALAEMQRRGQDFLLLDVREIDEYDVSHIPGAIQIDPGADASEVKALLANADPDTPVIVYCSVGRRSSILGSRVQGELEGREIANVRGGVFAWHNESRPLEDTGGATEYVHPYNRHWGKLLDRGTLAAIEPRS